MELLPEDRDLLQGLANIYNAVDGTSEAKACETYRDLALRNRDRLAIGADALRLFFQTRGKSVDLETQEWREYFALADGLQKPGRNEQRNTSAHDSRLRQLRASARLTIVWGEEIVEHHGFTKWDYKRTRKPRELRFRAAALRKFCRGGRLRSARET